VRENSIPHLFEALFINPGDKRTMPEKPSHWMSGYHSFLLRLWRENHETQKISSADPVWRGSLQCTDSGEVLVFTTLEDLFNFLIDLTTKLEKSMD
jgi:hypothetical protein